MPNQLPLSDILSFIFGEQTGEKLSSLEKILSTFHSLSFNF